MPCPDIDLSPSNPIASSGKAASRERISQPSSVPLSHTYQPQDALLSSLPLPLRGRFYPLGFEIEIHTNEDAVLRCARDTFAHWHYKRPCSLPPIRVAVHPGTNTKPLTDPIQRQFNHLYSLVADNENQAILDLRSGSSFAWITRPTAANSMHLRYSFLEKLVYLLLGSSVVTDIHAACIAKASKGILLCGASGAGKSTLAYACARAGWTYTSDDTCYLLNNSATPRVLGHAHRARFRPHARELFAELRSKPLSPRLDGKPSIEVPTSELPIRHSATEAPIHAAVFLQRDETAKARFTSLPPGTTTTRLSAELFSAGEIRQKHGRALQTLANLPAFKFQYCDLDEAIRALEVLTDSL